MRLFVFVLRSRAKGFTRSGGRTHAGPLDYEDVVCYVNPRSATNQQSFSEDLQIAIDCHDGLVSFRFHTPAHAS